MFFITVENTSNIGMHYVDIKEDNDVDAMAKLEEWIKNRGLDEYHYEKTSDTTGHAMFSSLNFNA